MKKRLLALILAVWIAAALTGCQSVNNTQSQTSESVSETSETSSQLADPAQYLEGIQSVLIDGVYVKFQNVQILPKGDKRNLEDTPVLIMSYNVSNFGEEKSIDAYNYQSRHLKIMPNGKEVSTTYFPKANIDYDAFPDLNRYISNNQTGSYLAALKITEDIQDVTIQFIGANTKNVLGEKVIPLSKIEEVKPVADPTPTPKPTATPKPSATPQPTEKPTTGESNALRSAKDYLKYMPFSYTGLIEQLEYEGYSTEEATYAVDNCGADWYKQAEKEADSYLKYSAFSYTGLIDQLEYEGYTSDQATQAADNCGADWFEQAAKCAESYLKYMSFSRDELISQLEYEGFTHEQAVYGAEENGY